VHRQVIEIEMGRRFPERRFGPINEPADGPWGGTTMVSVMAAGDAQRVWFPEMIDKLRSHWHQGMSFDAIVELRDDLDTMLRRIRSERRIRPPVFRCSQCGHVGEGSEPHVSVRAMILSLLRFNIAAAEQIHALEKTWAMYRKQNGLDLYGKGQEQMHAHSARCVHSQVR
jgi:hypothetical protein